jgi:hypothetical protein
MNLLKQLLNIPLKLFRIIYKSFELLYNIIDYFISNASKAIKIRSNICKILMVVIVVDVILPDPIPYIDEIIFIGSGLRCSDIRTKLTALSGLGFELITRIP